jgi:hypothetical protein
MISNSPRGVIHTGRGHDCTARLSPVIAQDSARGLRSAPWFQGVAAIVGMDPGN